MVIDQAQEAIEMSTNATIDVVSPLKLQALAQVLEYSHAVADE